MNYYERHLGDYARDAGHLSMIEHGAYTLLLDRYYTTEQPIPQDQVYRVTRAISKAERGAVDAVLREFFLLQGDAWTNRRAAAEIEKAQGKITAARENGKHGGRPKHNPEGTQQKPTGFSLGSVLETQTKAHQTPDTKQEQDQELCASPSGEAPTRADPIPYQAIADAYNRELTRLPKVRSLGADRRTLIRQAWHSDTSFQSIGFWADYFAACEGDDFRNGRGPYLNGHENWRPDFDYLMRVKVVRKLVERVATPEVAA